MEDPVLEIPLKTDPAIQMVAQWIANGGNGQHGNRVQKHAVEEVRPPEGELEKRQKMEEIVRAPQQETSHATPTVAQLIVNGDSGHLGDPALSPAVEELNFPQE